MGCMPRRLVVEEQLSTTTGSRRMHGYGKRWCRVNDIILQEGVRRLVTPVKWRHTISQLLAASVYIIFMSARACTGIVRCRGGKETDSCSVIQQGYRLTKLI